MYGVGLQMRCDSVHGYSSSSVLYRTNESIVLMEFRRKMGKKITVNFIGVLSDTYVTEKGDAIEGVFSEVLTKEYLNSLKPSSLAAHRLRR